MPTTTPMTSTPRSPSTARCSCDTPARRTHTTHASPRT
jgi:hypothetical protein